MKPLLETNFNNLYDQLHQVENYIDYETMDLIKKCIQKYQSTTQKYMLLVSYEGNSGIRFEILIITNTELFDLTYENSQLTTLHLKRSDIKSVQLKNNTNTGASTKNNTKNNSNSFLVTLEVTGSNGLGMFYSTPNPKYKDTILNIYHFLSEWYLEGEVK